MRVLKYALAVSTILGAAACQQPQKPQAADDLTWLDSLSLANPAVDSLAVASDAELGLAPSETPARAAPVRTVARTSSTSNHSSSSSSRSSSSHHHSHASGGSSSASGSGTVARQPRVTTVKHTKRDAAIGAATGAVAGAVVGGGHHRVRNAAIGAAVGGVLGAVVGNNVDKSKRIEW